MAIQVTWREAYNELMGLLRLDRPLSTQETQRLYELRERVYLMENFDWV